VCSASDTNTNSLLVCAEATWYHLSPLNLFDYRDSAILSKDWDLPSDLTMIAGPELSDGAGMGEVDDRMAAAAKLCTSQA
jgi:hypothetical protein